MDAGEKKALADIEEYGCHVIHVLEDEEGPPFAYSVGVQKTSGVPEVMVIGLKQPIAHFVVNEYNTRVRAGERFRTGERYSGFLDGFPVQFESVAPQHFDENLGWNKWLYGGNTFEALQIIYPTTEGVWPWEPAASEWFRQRQPILNDHLSEGGLTWPFDQARNVAAVSDALVVNRSAPILRVIHYSEDHSWAFLSGAPFEVENGKLIGMGTALGLDPTLRSIADLPPGWSATRMGVGDEWVRQPDPDV
jgi:hypothetical protein